jgi:uncharacterized membrane protein
VLRSERPARHAAPSPLLRTFCRDATGATATRRLATRALGAATLTKLLVWRAAICVCALDEGNVCMASTDDVEVVVCFAG